MREAKPNSPLPLGEGLGVRDKQRPLTLTLSRRERE